MDNKNEKVRTEGASVFMQQHDAPPIRKRSSAAVWAMLGVLAIALAVAVAYDYSFLKKHNLQISQVVDSVTGLTRRLDVAEARLRDWGVEQASLSERLGKLDRKVSSNFRLARKRTMELIAQTQKSLEDEMDKRTQVINARLTEVESNQEADRTRLTKLQEEIAGVRQELAAVRRETRGELSSLSREQSQSQNKLEAISTQLARRRVDFEVTKKETRELVPGISLTILHTNVSYQRYDGWIYFLPDRRTLWIEDQGAQEPLVFRQKQGGEPYELVVTGVDKHGATGYLLLPAVEGTGAAAAATAEVGASVPQQPGL